MVCGVLDCVDLAQERVGREFLWVLQWNFGFHEMLEISWQAENLSDPQEALRSNNLICLLFS